MLSTRGTRGHLAAVYKELRNVFDVVLLEAWAKRGGPAEHYYEFYEARSRTPFLAFEMWKESHDLLGKKVWQSGNQVASLTDVPGADEIALYNGGTSANTDLILEWRSERRYQRLSSEIPAALRTIFADR